MHGVSRWSRRAVGSLVVSISWLLVFALPAAADTKAPQAESTVMVQSSGMPIGTLFWGVAGAAAMIVGWAMTRRPRGLRLPEQALATD